MEPSISWGVSAGTRNDGRRVGGEQRPDGRRDHFPGGGYPNIIAVDSIGIVAPALDGLANFSSRGPCPGGILKPHLVAPGGMKEECIFGQACSLLRVPMDVDPRRGAAHALHAVPVVTGLPRREREISPFVHMDSARTRNGRGGHEVDAG